MAAISQKTYRDVNTTLLVFGMCAWLVLGLAALSVAQLLPDWLDSFVGLLTYCPYKARTGLACMLCGSTTAALELLSGNLAASLEINPIAGWVLPTGLVQPPYRLLRILRPRLRLAEELSVWGACLAGGVLLVTAG